MKHLRRIKNYIISLLIMAFVLPTLASLPACKQAQHNVQLSTQVPQTPQTTQVTEIPAVPETNVIPTDRTYTIHPKFTPDPESVETPNPNFFPDPDTMLKYTSMYGNPYEAYTTELKKMLNGDRSTFSFDPLDGLSTYLLFEDGKLVIRSAGNSGFYGPSYWKYFEPETIFTFPNPDIWYDIFPPGATLAGWVRTSESSIANTEIIIPKYNQHVDGCSYPVIFGGDWMVVYLGSFFDNACPHFHGQDEWAEKNLRAFPHTWILRTDDGWNTWEHIDSVEADAIASQEHCTKYIYHEVDSNGTGSCHTFSLFGAHISSNGVGYISYRINASWESWLIYRPGSMELIVTTDWGKHWTLVTRENASEFGLSINTCGIQLTYFEGLHGIGIFTVRNIGEYNEEFGSKYLSAEGSYFAESFDGGKTWKRISDYMFYTGYYVTYP